MNVFHHSQPAALDVRPAHALEWALRVLGALSLLAVGAVHLQQYDALYSAIPTIGTLFVLNFAGATAIGLGLLLPVERLFGRLGGVLPALLGARRNRPRGDRVRVPLRERADAALRLHGAWL